MIKKAGQGVIDNSKPVERGRPHACARAYTRTCARVSNGGFGGFRG